jgi:hypothetical protein
LAFNSEPDVHRSSPRDGILAAIRLWLTNPRIEGLKSKFRPISHRSAASTARTPHRPHLPLAGDNHHRTALHHQLVGEREIDLRKTPETKSVSRPA